MKIKGSWLAAAIVMGILWIAYDKPEHPVWGSGRNSYPTPKPQEIWKPREGAESNHNYRYNNLSLEGSQTYRIIRVDKRGPITEIEVQNRRTRKNYTLEGLDIEYDLPDMDEGLLEEEDGY